MTPSEVFEPSRLRLARDLQQRSQTALARDLGLSAAAVGQYEAGLVRPNPKSIAAMAKALGVPSNFFFMPLVETHEGFFRSLRRTSVGHRRRARALAYIAHDAAVAAGPSAFPRLALPEIMVTSLDADHAELELVAAQVRAELRLPDGPIPNVVDLLERHGVVVIRLPLDTADVDAFSLPFPNRPVVILGADKADRARSRFDAAHELGHLVAHGDQVWGLKQVEQQAHMFAAAFLMPAEQIYEALPGTADWATLFDLKREWQVSLAALLMRARTLGKMSDSQYLTAIKAASARGWRRVEPVPLGAPESPILSRALLASPQCRRAMDALPSDVVDALVHASAA